MRQQWPVLAFTALARICLQADSSFSALPRALHQTHFYQSVRQFCRYKPVSFIAEVPVTPYCIYWMGLNDIQSNQLILQARLLSGNVTNRIRRTQNTGRLLAS